MGLEEILNAFFTYIQKTSKATTLGGNKTFGERTDQKKCQIIIKKNL